MASTVPLKVERQESPVGLPAGSDNGDAGMPSSQYGSRQQVHRTRPIRACTHCRQQKIKCNASDTYPVPCERCSHMGRKCVVDPLFRPQKGGQVQILKEDVSSLKQQVETLQERALQLMNVITKQNANGAIPDGVVKQLTEEHSRLLADAAAAEARSQQAQREAANGAVSGDDRVSPGGVADARRSWSGEGGLPPSPANANASRRATLPPRLDSDEPVTKRQRLVDHAPGLTDQQSALPPLATVVATPPQSTVVNNNINSHAANEPKEDFTEFVLGDTKISRQRGDELHARFMADYLPYLPIILSNSASELYRQSRMLFWTVVITASLSEPDPSLYLSLVEPLRLLVNEACWMSTPRSTHIVQALLILGTWPLPNDKILDDFSYRFVCQAKSIGIQLGLHRGQFIYEFSRSQTTLPDAEKWRTRTWLALFFTEHVWCANLGLPPNTQIDYLVDKGTEDQSLPATFRSLLRLSAFYSKLTGVMGSSTTTPDGVIEPKSRCATLYIMEQELSGMERSLDLQNPVVELYFLYMKCIIATFAFLPGTSTEDQAKYVVMAFHSATRIVTVISKLGEARKIVEYPIYMRQPVSFAALLLFRLHLSPLLMPQFVERARQSVVTVHRLFRNSITAWKDVKNDITRTARVLENLNFVIITHPYLLTQAPGLICRMRCHLTASLFYELVWAVHEARRRSNRSANEADSGPLPGGHLVDTVNSQPQNAPPAFSHLESIPPLPFYNQITRDDFTTQTQTTPNGTTVTTLVPTHPGATSMFGRSHDASSRSTPMANPPNPSDLHAALNDAAPGRSADPLASQKPSTGRESSTAANAFLDSTGASDDPLHLDTLMQGIDWMNNNEDDFLGWMDMGMSPP